jgi:hypothetical protein
MQLFAGDKSSAELKGEDLLEVDTLTGLSLTVADVFGQSPSVPEPAHQSNSVR